MRKVIIRDDDTSFFTQPALLERIYGRLWQAGKPVCLAVIPAQNSNVRVLHRTDKRYDPSIPPRYRGIEAEHPITANAELCAFLNDLARAGLVELMLHGYAHSYREFRSDDREALRRKLVEGKAMLRQAFPDAKIRTFIAPYDTLSQTALELVFEQGFNLCTHSDNLAPFPTLAGMGGYRSKRLPGGMALFTADEYLFTDKTPPDQCLVNALHRQENEALLIMANHYWTFYDDWNGPIPAMHARWNEFLDVLLASRDVLTFSAYAARFAA